MIVEIEHSSVENRYLSFSLETVLWSLVSCDIW
jgi:hypothetical protein